MTAMASGDFVAIVAASSSRESRAGSWPVQDSQAGQGLALDEFQAGPAAGGDVTKCAVAEAEGVDGRAGVAAPDQAERLAADHRRGHGPGAVGVRSQFEDAHRAVPEDRLGP